MIHVAKSSFGQCQCYWCGRRPRFSPECAVTIEVRRAIKDFAAKFGRNWRQKLKFFWESKDDFELLGPELKKAKLLIGPSQLSKVTEFLLKRVN